MFSSLWWWAFPTSFVGLSFVLLRERSPSWKRSPVTGAFLPFVFVSGHSSFVLASLGWVPTTTMSRDTPITSPFAFQARQQAKSTWPMGRGTFCKTISSASSLPQLSLLLVPPGRCVKYQETRLFLSYKEMQSRTWSDVSRIYFLDMISDNQCVVLQKFDNIYSYCVHQSISPQTFTEQQLCAGYDASHREYHSEDLQSLFSAVQHCGIWGSGGWERNTEELYPHSISALKAF